MSREPDLDEVARRALEAALAAGAEQAEAWCERAGEREIRVYKGEVESLTDATSAGLGVRALGGGRTGYSYGTDMSDHALREVAASACETMAVADVDEHAGLPEECGATPVKGLASDELARWTNAERVELALAIERAARARPGVTQVEDTVYADGRGLVAMANSSGFSSSYETTSAWAYASAFAGEGTELMTGLGVGIGRDPGALDPEAIGVEAAERARALRGARQPASRRCPVVLDAFVAASFISVIGGMLSADAAQRGRSPFAGREGEEIAARALRVVDDGTEPQGMASSPFDGEGSPRARTPLLAEGRLATLLFDARTARRAGGERRTTGNASRRSYRSPPIVAATNLVVEPGEETLDDLAKRAGDGILVTDVSGLHSGVNPVSGTFSVGAVGRLIEGGELRAPVREMTIASDIESMLRSVVAVGREGRWIPFGGAVKSAPLLIGEMAVSGS